MNGGITDFCLSAERRPLAQLPSKRGEVCKTSSLRNNSDVARTILAFRMPASAFSTVCDWDGWYQWFTDGQLSDDNLQILTLALRPAAIL